MSSIFQTTDRAAHEYNESLYDYDTAMSAFRRAAIVLASEKRDLKLARAFARTQKSNVFLHDYDYDCEMREQAFADALESYRLSKQDLKRAERRMRLARLRVYTRES